MCLEALENLFFNVFDVGESVPTKAGILTVVPGGYRKGRQVIGRPVVRTDARTCSSDDSREPGCRLTIRLTHFGRLGSRIFWKMTVLWRQLSESPATPTAGPRNSMTAAARRFCSKTWRGFGTDRKGQREVQHNTRTRPKISAFPMRRSEFSAWSGNS